MKDVRVTFSRRHAYATKSNVLKVVKTPGGRLVGAYRSKKRQGPKCGDCGTPLPGIKHLSSFAYKNTHKRERTVSRAYGGRGRVAPRVAEGWTMTPPTLTKRRPASVSRASVSGAPTVSGPPPSGSSWPAWRMKSTSSRPV